MWTKWLNEYLWVNSLTSTMSWGCHYCYYGDLKTIVLLALAATGCCQAAQVCQYEHCVTVNLLQCAVSHTHLKITEQTSSVSNWLTNWERLVLNNERKHSHRKALEKRGQRVLWVHVSACVCVYVHVCKCGSGAKTEIIPFLLSIIRNTVHWNRTIFFRQLQSELVFGIH